MGFKIAVQEYEERMQVPEGKWPGILVETIDIGSVPTEWDTTKKEDSIVMVWAVFVDIDGDGNYASEDSQMLFEQRYKKSLFSGGVKKSGEIVNPSNLYKHLAGWKGEAGKLDITDCEFIVDGEMDFDKLKGQAAWLDIFHRNGYAAFCADGAIEPYIDADRNLIPKENWPVVKNYKRPDQSWRAKGRQKKEQAQAPAPAKSPGVVDDEIPF